MVLIPVGKLNETVGAGLLGVVLSSILYGITCAQTFNYYTSYPNDRVFLKTLVAGLWVLDTIHMSFVIIMIYHYTVTHWGDPLALAETTWSLTFSILVGNILTVVVQSFYAYRIYRLSGGNVILPCVIVVLSLCQLGFGIAYMLHNWRAQFIALSESRITSITGSIAISTDLLCDLFISITMCILLHRNDTGWKGSSRIINTLITYTINTCVLLTVCTVALLVTFLTFPSSLIFGIFYYILCRLYTNATLSMLNSRNLIRKIAETTSSNGDVVNLRTMDFQPAASANCMTQSVKGEKSTSGVYIQQPT